MDAPPATVRDWLEEWIAGQRNQLQPATWKGYRGALDRHLLPALGGVRFNELHARHLNQLYSQMASEPGYRGTPLSLTTIRYLHAVLHKALRDAVRLDLLVANPADKATLPKRTAGAEQKQHGRAWTADELRRFLAYVARHPRRDLWHLAAATGMRRGELLGLRWQDVDLGGHTLRVRRALSVVDGHAQLKAPKSGRTRTLHLDATTAAQLQERQDRLTGPTMWDLVFTDADGHYLDPMRITLEFRRLVVGSGLPRLRLHDLRHTHATLLLMSGVPVKVVSERLGHSQISLTMDLYAHVLPAMDAEAADRFAACVYPDRLDNGAR